MLRKLNISYFKKKTKATDTVKENLSQKKAQSVLLQYQTIDDLPMWNFRKVINSGDSRYLYILDNYQKLPDKPIKKELWEDIFWEYIEAKGMDFNSKRRLELKAKIAILENEELFEGKKNHTKIEMTKLKLEELQRDTNINTDLENDAILCKFMGFNINPKKTTVSQYIGFEKLLIEANKNNGSNNR